MYKKNLGAESALLITTLASQGQSVFSIADAQKASGKDYAVVVQEIRRLVKSGSVVKLRSGHVCFGPTFSGAEAIPEANRFVIARALMGNASYYFSHDSAFEIHNMLTRPVTTVTITSPRALRRSRYHKCSISLYLCQSRRFMGSYLNLGNAQ